MCDNDRKHPFALLASIPKVAASSRRTRLWELPHNCHCPVIGVCLPLNVLHKLVCKALGGQVQGDEYEVHVGAVSECGSRNRMSEMIHACLDERYAGVLRQFRAARERGAVLELWRAAVARGDVAGAFWAGLTHPRCDALLQDTLVREMHMIQHQAGASVRVDLALFQSAMQARRLLEQELARLRDRHARAIELKAEELAAQGAQLALARADLAAREAALLAMQRELEQMKSALPELSDRQRLLRRVEDLQQRERSLSVQVAQLRQQASAAIQGAGHAASAMPAGADGASQLPAAEPMPAIGLADKTVLCVGGRNGNVPNYRKLIEKEGARFMHHDGGEQDASDLLDSGLAAADLVICQTGCISHQAYWRVKEFCKRTGKQCVYVDNPSTSSFSYCLRKIAIRDLSRAADASV